ncbi:hypothetical protein CCP4SC76_4860002 [Gammaproteobacteria bacterium]
MSSNMILAIPNGETFIIGESSSLFPGVSFPAVGPDQDWLTENNAHIVVSFIQHDPLTHKLAPSDPYLLSSGEVCNVSLMALNSEEIRDLTIPQKVTRFQAQAALQMGGLLAQVEAVINDPSTEAIYRLAWNNVLEFYRDSPLLLAMGHGVLGLTEAEIDQLFIAASSIEI